MKIEMANGFDELVCPRMMKVGKVYRSNRKEQHLILCCDNTWVNLTTNRVLTKIENFTECGWEREWEEVNAKVVVA